MDLEQVLMIGTLKCGCSYDYFKVLQFQFCLNISYDCIIMCNDAEKVKAVKNSHEMAQVKHKKILEAPTYTYKLTFSIAVEG